MQERPTPDQLADAYRAARLRFTELAHTVSPDDEAKNVQSCPAWSVRDLVSHNVGLATDLGSGAPIPGDTQQWIDDMVATRSNTPVVAQLDEWGTTGPVFEDALRSNPRLAALVVDVVSHEHDLAHAIGTTGDRSAPEIGLALDLTAGMAARDLAAKDLQAIRLVSEDGERVWGEGDVELEIRASLFEIFRVTGGRRSHDQMMALDHTGDMARYMAGVSHNELPVADIIE